LILFLPAGCTREFQPADLILQHVFKHIMSCEFNALMARLVKKHLDGRKTFKFFSLNTRLGLLHYLTPGFLNEAYNCLLANPVIVTRSWIKAVVDVPDDNGQLNLLDAWDAGFGT
jgi:hypothetical protein